MANSESDFLYIDENSDVWDGKVDATIMRSWTEFNASHKEKAVSLWQQGYKRAVENKTHFLIAYHLYYAHYLVFEGRCDQSWALLNRLMAYAVAQHANSPRDLKCLDSYHQNARNIEDVMVYQLIQEARCVDALTHQLLSLLHYQSWLTIRKETMPDVYMGVGKPEQYQATAIKSIKRILTKLKRNKKGRPEAIAAILPQHVPSLPKVDAQTLTAQIKEIVDGWS